MALLKAEKDFVIILAKYLDVVNMFFEKLAVILSKYININTYIINLKKSKQSLYKLIYSLD